MYNYYWPNNASYNMLPYYRLPYVRAPLNAAFAEIKGGPLAPSIRGTVYFQAVPGGVIVCANVTGLPPFSPASGSKPQVGPFGFHIHEKGSCEVTDKNDPFKGAGGHYNPTNQPHGNHVGDFPVLIPTNGLARMCFYTSKFTIDEIVGRSVMIHESPDDYKSQPAGNSGRRLACGIIKSVRV